MKKTLTTILLLLIILISIVFMLYTYMQSTKKSAEDVQKFNQGYEQYTDKEITGTELATLIGKAINNNEKNNITKDSKGIYISDNAYALKIFVKFTDNDTIYDMGAINGNGIEKFIKNYNTITFKCTEPKYSNKTGRIIQMIFYQT